MSTWALVSGTCRKSFHCILGFTYMKKRRSFAHVEKRIDKNELTIKECFLGEGIVDWKIKGLINLLPAVVATTNEQYLILLGGFEFHHETYKAVKSIFVLNVRTKKLMKSSIKLPVTNLEYGHVFADEVKDLSLVFAYINNLWKCEEFSDISALPIYLIKLIAKWICFEKVHLTTSKKQDRYWEIDIDQILQSIHE